MEERIKLNDTTMDILMKMSRGNPVANKHNIELVECLKCPKCGQSEKEN